MDFIKLLEEKSLLIPDKPAIIFKGQNITFKSLRDLTFRLGLGLKGLGIKRNTKAAIYLPNCPQYIYSYLGIWFNGATAVPLDFMLTQEELISCLAHSQAQVLIAKLKSGFSLKAIRESCPALKEIILYQTDEESLMPDEKAGTLPLEELLSRQEVKFSRRELKPYEYAIIFYTSGTTGRPKGVLINYAQIGAGPMAMEYFVDFTQEDIILCSLPFSHLGGLIYIQNTIVFGLTLVLMEHFAPLEFLKNIQAYRVTCFWIVPSMYYAFLQLKEFETFDLSTLRWMVTFGASNSPDALRRFHQYCPKAHLLNGWGLTETNAPTTVIQMGSDKIESVGRPAPWIEVKIFDEQDKELPVGKAGEIAVRSWVVTDGYYKDPETTAAVLRNGWFHTGDLGRFDNEGDLYIVGRLKEMIKVSGEIVFEPEVELAIQKHAGILEAAVIGVADKLRGEVPKAFIVFKDKQQQIKEEDLRYFLRQHLAHFKIPHYFEFVESLPKNRTGKIDKEILRKSDAGYQRVNPK
ncbi:MAG TPA: AMP-binding protein [Candidatus Omnitrophota bacterium]|nr:AMP-binding protein [Candidatus Omnitrophota bacterium]